MIFRFVREHTGIFRVETMCRILKVSRSGYYRWRMQPCSDRKQQDIRLQSRIQSVHANSRSTYGSPRIHRQLRKNGIRCGKKRIERLMREAGLRAIGHRRYKATTNSRHALPVAANQLNRRFAIDQPNRAWVSDITYISTREGWLYLAAVMDLYSRKIVGWAMKDRLTQELAIDALVMAIRQRRPNPGLLHHSDRGSQYASAAYQTILKRHQMCCSMSRTGNCWDNAVMESFFHTLKTELVQHRRYHTREQARLDIFEYIEAFYNRIRLHSAIGYMSPINYENRRKVA